MSTPIGIGSWRVSRWGSSRSSTSAACSRRRDRPEQLLRRKGAPALSQGCQGRRTGAGDREGPPRQQRAEGLRGISRERTRKTTVSESAETERPADLVDRNFGPLTPNRLWVADLTYISTWSGWCYTSFVIDAYARRITRSLADRAGSGGALVRQDAGVVAGDATWLDPMEALRLGLTGTLRDRSREEIDVDEWGEVVDRYGAATRD
jgi:hypothetical protein